MTPKAILFDFDGVLIESEYEGNRHLADYLTGIGHPIDVEETMRHFMGLSGHWFTDAVEARIGRALPEDFFEVRRAENERVLAAGLDPVDGAIAFVRALPPALPVAVASSSRTRWLERHLEHIGLAGRFGPHLYSGQEHVEHGKPAPDLYLHAARQLGVRIEDCAIIEDSPIGVRGAAKSGGFVVGLCAGRHCAVGHAQRLRDEGADVVAASFVEVATLLQIDVGEGVAAR
ncbi:HAD superfamily hydrolase (TIGR01509 family) [Sphingomonas jejuensis]|uniref:HAD superfamily hydrolase (TIGR01509 family) n=1 Tax=Sphingomonas jejuensis TaxID=904715 RepID=A0ABX0XP71_9SPHN|nr:HAD family phosphatase [Sphingomonas jejuensis]NJC35025.1 HAD superfamily hydrolase (TIGR01509 family) [Sphingomonas jejuensis]